ncbi:MAG: DUF397 domain-containing protein [Streptosporangiaceae bacterium]|nr:DUF397 domain-containing protein [Streptosporangiaceae bacterium]
MEAVDPRWRKSSYSGNGGGTCVEVGHVDGTVGIRDTKQHGQGPVLRVAPEAWREFVRQVTNKDG